MKTTPNVLYSKFLFVACLSFLMLSLVSQAQVDDSTTVYYQQGKKRVHVADCPRYKKSDTSLFTTMTLGEAKAKGLSLCSRCPGSATPKGVEKAAPATPKQAAAPKQAATPAPDLAPDTIVYYSGKRRVHVASCPRYKREDPTTFTTMTWAEAQAKGLTLCSRCPGSMTSK